MFWDKEYKRNQRVWGGGPSELAVIALEYMQKCKPNNEVLSILDIGCGYGRDTCYFSDNLRCKILGIDISEEAIGIASNEAIKRQKEDVRFQCCTFSTGRYGLFLPD